MDSSCQLFVDHRSSASLLSGMARKKGPSHPIEEKKALGASIAAARRAAGYSQDAAASALGVVKQTVSAWESGTNVVDAIWLRKLARLYQSSADKLAGADSAEGAIWPLSLELQDEVLRLDPEDMHHLERAMWSHLRKEVPQELHYDSDERAKRAPRPAPPLIDLGSPSRESHKRTG